MNLPALISFLLLGVVSVMMQLTLQRELITAFYGNEIFIGVVMASWMLWTAIGARLCHPRGSNRGSHACNCIHEIPAYTRGDDKLFVLSILLLGFVFFGEVVALRYIKNIIGFPGEVPNLLYGLLVAALSPAPICLLLGAWWTHGISSMFKAVDPQNVNRSYLVETLGFVAGSLAFGLIFAKRNEVMLAATMMTFCLSLLFLLAARSSPKRWAPLLAAFIISMVFTRSPIVSTLNLDTAALRFKGQTLLESVNSNYGNIAVTKFGEQLNFFENGVLLGTTEAVQSTEELIHLALLQHPSPKKVLLIGGGLFGEIAEIKKHKVDDIYYVELDPELIHVAERYISFEPKTHVIIEDGFYYLRSTDDDFDVIIMNLPAPSTELVNRFYTKEFFELAGHHLNKGGIFCNRLPSSQSTLNKNLETLDSSIYRTLGQAFEHVLFLPEDSLIFLSSNEDVLTYDPKIVTSRFEQRGIKTRFLPPEYFAFRLTTDRIDQLKEVFERNKNARINHRFRPASYFYQNLFWLDLFYPRLEYVYKMFAASQWTILSLVAIFAAAAFFSARKRPSYMPLISVGCAGFSLMALEMVVIFAYQAVVGYLYYRLAILIAAIMLGMAIGVVFGIRLVPKERERRNLVISHCLMFLFAVIFLASLPAFSEAVTITQPELALVIFAVCSGFFGAIIFPMANRLYRDFGNDPSAIYGADLIGSSIGALLPSLVLIPAMGIPQTLGFVAALNILMAVSLYSSPNT